MSRAIQLASLIGFLSTAPCAHAELVTWTLQNVTFLGGGTATGSFSLDTTRIDQTSLGNPIASFDIKTTPGTLVSTGAEYSSATPGGGNFALYKGKEAPFSTFADISIGLPDPADPSNPSKLLRTLLFTLERDLTAAGGTVQLTDGAEFVGVVPDQTSRPLSGGSIDAPVPEPFSWTFVGIGATFLWLLRNSRKTPSSGGRTRS